MYILEENAVYLAYIYLAYIYLYRQVHSTTQA